jgi:hypothetical protein
MSVVNEGRSGTGKEKTEIGQKKVLVGLMIGCFFLVGTSSGMAALWDRNCQIAIEDLQRLQQEISVKKQEVDTERVVEAIPSNFVSGQLQAFLRASNGKSQAVNELKGLFKNIEFAVAAFSRSCLKSHRVSQ